MVTGRLHPGGEGEAASPERPGLPSPGPVKSPGRETGPHRGRHRRSGGGVRLQGHHRGQPESRRLLLRPPGGGPVPETPTGPVPLGSLLKTSRLLKHIENGFLTRGGNKSMERSFETIRQEDLARLAQLALEDQAAFFCRHPDIAAVYRDRLLCIALCQGAALHYIDGKHGVKDFDVWVFYREAPARRFPRRRPRMVRDFEDPRFGQSEDAPHFRGRRVDLFAKSIDAPEDLPFAEAVRQYLRASKTPAARFLAKKAVVVVYPDEARGKILWPMQA